MGHTNPADHERLQQLLKRYFTPATINTLRPQVRQITHELLDAVAPAGRMDVVTDLAYPLPANVIANMLGMPTGDRQRLQAWSRDIVAIFQIADVDALRRCQRSTLEMQEYLRPLIAQRRIHPSDDILSVFVAAQHDGTVSEQEILANCVLLLFAGHETTAGLIANGLALLLQHPDQLALLRRRPDLTPSAVEEMLRYDGPASAVMRVSEQPVELAGHSFPANTQFHLAMLAGNRDPDVFADPELFDITRTGNRHTAFGLGAFYCLGAALARMEADECFRILLDRFPDIRPRYQTPDRESDSPLGRRLRSLPVEW
jgi:cytochrome P450